jgi:hypothetical protein
VEFKSRKPKQKTYLQVIAVIVQKKKNRFLKNRLNKNKYLLNRNKKTKSNHRRRNPYSKVKAMTAQKRKLLKK